MLLADIFHALVGEPHPMRPEIGAREKARQRAELFARLKAQRERLARQRERDKTAPDST